MVGYTGGLAAGQGPGGAEVPDEAAGASPVEDIGKDGEYLEAAAPDFREKPGVGRAENNMGGRDVIEDARDCRSVEAGAGDAGGPEVRCQFGPVAFLCEGKRGYPGLGRKGGHEIHRASLVAVGFGSTCRKAVIGVAIIAVLDE